MNDFDYFDPSQVLIDDYLILHPESEQKEYEKNFIQKFMQERKTVIGSFLLLLVLSIAFIVPKMNAYSYSEQDTRFINTPPVLKLIKVAPNSYIHINGALRVISVSEDGQLLGVLTKISTEKFGDDPYIYCGKELRVRYDGTSGKEMLFINGQNVSPEQKLVWNKTHPLGTDSLGRDVLARVLMGVRISLAVGVLSALVSVGFGSFYGGVAGYSHPRVGEFMMRVADIIDSIPTLLVVILLMMVINPSLITVILTISLLFWTGVARQVRSQILSLRENEFILAARVLGVKKYAIILRHLIPNSIIQIIVAMTVDVPTAIFSEAFLSFLGLGVSIPAASLGSLTSDAISGVRLYPYQVLIPSIAIAMIVFAFNMLGEGMQKIMNSEKKYFS